MRDGHSERPKQVRKRAVRLTSEGLALLEGTIAEAIDSRKPTRSEVANALGLSIGTSQKVLRGEGVDRASLVVAFESLGLLWTDEHCEFIAKDCPETSPPTYFAVVESAPVADKKVSWRRWMIGSSLALAVAIGFFAVQRPTPSPNDLWFKEFDSRLRAAIFDHEKARYGRAQAEIDDAIALARPHPDQSYLASALLVAGDISAAGGSLLVAKDRYGEALRLRTALGERAAVPPLLEALGRTETRLREFAPAGKHLREGLAGFTALGDRVGYAMVCRSLGEWAIEKGDDREASGWLEKGLAVAVKEGKSDLVADIRARGALIKRDEGKYAEARDVLAHCLDHWTARSHPRWIATTLFQMATVEYRAGRYRDARGMLTRSMALFSELGDEAGTSECATWITKTPS